MLLPFRRGGWGFLCLFLSLVLSSCGGSGSSFSIEGKLKNFNQGEFYVYSLDDALTYIDTIKVDRGQFAYEFFGNEPTTLVIVFPNFSEYPILTTPGEGVEITGDATNLSELDVSGTDDNELMTLFRKKILGISPPDIPKVAEEFVMEHLQSRASEYIVLRYIMQGFSPDYAKAEKLLETLAENQPENVSVKRLFFKARSMANTMKERAVPTFSATDLKQRQVSSNKLKEAEVGVVFTCATWNYESMDALRRLNRLQRTSRGRLSVVSMLVDGNSGEMKRIMERDSISLPVLFDPSFFDGKIVRQFGLSSVADNIVYHNGRVHGSHFSGNDLVKEVEQLLKKH